MNKAAIGVAADRAVASTLSKGLAELAVRVVEHKVNGELVVLRMPDELPYSLGDPFCVGMLGSPGNEDLARRHVQKHQHVEISQSPERPARLVKKSHCHSVEPCMRKNSSQVFSPRWGPGSSPASRMMLATV